MTVNFTTAQISFLGNDSTTVFNFGFPIYDLADMQVFLTDINDPGVDTEQLSNFTVNPATPGIFPTIGTVTFPVSGSPIDSNTKITLRRKIPYAQGFLDLGRNQIINAGILEDALDRVVGMIQQNQTLDLRSLKVGLTEAELSVQEFVDTLIIATVDGAIIDNLVSSSITNALSANQGRVLKDLIDALPIVIDSLVSSSTTDSLSANQGLILKGLIDALPVVIDSLVSSSTTDSLSANQGLVLKGLIDALNPIPVKSNQSENETGTDDAKFVSPLGIRQAFFADNAAPVFALRARVSFNGTGVVAIIGSANVSSVTDNGVGNYTINFTTAAPSAVYEVSAIVKAPTVGNMASVHIDTKAAGSLSIRTFEMTIGAHTTSSVFDLTDINCSFFW